MDVRPPLSFVPAEAVFTWRPEKLFVTRSVQGQCIARSLEGECKAMSARVKSWRTWPGATQPSGVAIIVTTERVQAATIEVHTSRSFAQLGPNFSTLAARRASSSGVVIVGAEVR